MPDVDPTAPAPRYRKIVARIPGAVALLLASALYVWAMHRHVREILDRRAGLDFADYYFSAKAVLTQHAGVYDHRAMVALSNREIGTRDLPVFVYPPLLVVLFLPLSRLSDATAQLGWLAGNQILLGLMVWACARIHAEREGRRPGLVFCAVLALVAAAGYAPTWDHDWQGQSNMLVMALTAWGLHAHFGSRRSDLRVGALLAPAILLKLFPGIFVPFLLVRRAWRPTLWTGAVAVAVTAATLLWVRWSDYVRFPQVLFGSMYLVEGGETRGNYAMSAGAWWAGSLLGASPAVIRVAARAVQLVPCLAVFAVAALEARRDRASASAGLVDGPADGGIVPVLRISQGFILMGFVISKWWEHHLVFLLFPYFFAVRLAFVDGLADPRGGPRIRPWWAAAAVALSLLLVAPVRHPLVWELLGDARWTGLRDGLVQATRIGILLLGLGVEILIWQIRRLQAPATKAPAPPPAEAVTPPPA